MYELYDLFCRCAILCNDSTVEYKDNKIITEGDPTEIALKIMSQHIQQ